MSWCERLRAGAERELPGAGQDHTCHTVGAQRAGRRDARAPAAEGAPLHGAQSTGCVGVSQLLRKSRSSPLTWNRLTSKPTLSSPPGCIHFKGPAVAKSGVRAAQEEGADVKVACFFQSESAGLTPPGSRAGGPLVHGAPAWGGSG